jgi:hypothetical protein
MGAWGPGLWSDDTASDVRSTYRESLEDGASDEEARAAVLDDFAPDLGDEDARGVVWLALAAVQSSLGRLDDATRQMALAVIASGEDLSKWSHRPGVAKKRECVLLKLADQLQGPQPARKKVRRPSRPQTSLSPGDVVGYAAPSGRWYLLEVLALSNSRYFVAPYVRLLDYAGLEIPSGDTMIKLGHRRKGRSSQGGKPAEPWWCIEGVVTHSRGHDYDDCGFTTVGRRMPMSAGEQEALCAQLTSYAGWSFWSDYLDMQDELLGVQLADGAT